MEQTIMETVPSAISDRRNERVGKKRKSSAVDADCNSHPDDAPLQVRKRRGGAKRRKKSISNAGSNCNLENICEKASAQVSNPKRKGNDKVGCTNPDREAAGGKISGHSNPAEDRKSDTASQSLKTETTPSTICNQSKADKARRKRMAKKLKKSISNAGSNCIPEDLSLSRSDREVTDGEVTGYSNAVGSNSICRPSEDGKSDTAMCASLKTETAPSTICNQSQDHKAKKKQRRRNKSILNADSNCKPENICSQRESHFGGDLSVSHTSECTEANAKISNRKRKKKDKSGRTHHDRELTDGEVTGQSNPVGNDNSCCASEALSKSCDQSMEHDAKERKKSKRRKQSKKISNVDRTCNSSGSNGSAEVRELDILNQSCVIEIAPSTLCDQSMEDNAKERKKSKREKKMKKRNSSISNDDSNCNPDGNNFRASEVREPDILNQSCMIEIAPSTLCDQSMEHKAKERKKPKRIKKSKKRNSSISNADSNCNPDQADAEVSQMQRKDSDKAGGSHIDTEVVDGVVSYDSNIASQSCNIETAPSTVCYQSKEHKAKKKRQKKSRKINDSISNAQSKCDPDPISSAEISSYVSSEQKDVILPTLVVKAAGHSNRKLLILDLNGLLADVCPFPTPGYTPNTRVSGKAVYKRPYCDDFLQFCLETFDVGVWSSRMRKNVDSVVHCLMGNRRNRLIFCWDASHCTQTGCYTIENYQKPLVLKELRKLWEKAVPGLPWNKGAYDESNTLLIDDSPYKALRNPPYTGIFPSPYVHTNTEDNSLGPDGDLRLYLIRLATADNVQKFVAENPFGQSPITNSDPYWTFYSSIINNNTRRR